MTGFLSYRKNIDAYVCLDVTKYVSVLKNSSLKYWLCLRLFYGEFKTNFRLIFCTALKAFIFKVFLFI